MRIHDSANEIERSCNQCGSANWKLFEVDEYGGERDNDIEKSWFLCRDCGAEGKLYEESGNRTWSGNLR